MSKMQKQGILAITSNGLKGFWGHLKRKLTANGGIRRNYHFSLEDVSEDIIIKNLFLKKQKNLLFILFFKHFRSEN